jgi:hypothetical protein
MVGPEVTNLVRRVSEHNLKLADAEKSKLKQTIAYASLPIQVDRPRRRPRRHRHRHESTDALKTLLMILYRNPCTDGHAETRGTSGARNHSHEAHDGRTTHMIVIPAVVRPDPPFLTCTSQASQDSY